MDYNNMTIEQLLNAYYHARKDIDDYIDGNFVFSNNREENSKAVQERYSIRSNVVAELESRTEHVVYDGELIV